MLKYKIQDRKLKSALPSVVILLNNWSTLDFITLKENINKTGIITSVITVGHEAPKAKEDL